MTGSLILAGTPIGDVRDASPSLVAALEGAEVIAAEDTRRFRALTQRMGIETSARVVSYFEGNEASRTPALVDEIASGATVVLVTDAGMPSVSDPGYRLVVACIEAGLAVRVVPGPSAVLAALAVSGLPVDRFCFEGFLPRKHGERSRRLAELVAEPRTMVFFEAPHRLADFLTDAAAVLGDERRGAVCRELTKTYEEVVRGSLAELAAWAQGEVRGEITVVIAGAEPRVADLADGVAQVLAAVAAGERLKPAVASVSARTGLARNELYAASLDARQHERTQS